MANAVLRLPAVDDIVKVRVTDEDPSGSALRVVLPDYDNRPAIVPKYTMKKKKWAQRVELYGREMPARVLRVDTDHGYIDLMLK